ncbi:lysylphosphatidylglycerol synthase domain-containing protein [Streptomyces sp. PmtG]
MLFYATVVVLLAWQVWQVHHGFLDSMGSIGWEAVVLATGFTVLANFPGFFGWRILATSTGVRITLSDATWIYFASGAARYLPGAIWPAVAQAALARKVGESAARLVTTGLFALVLSTLSGIVVGLLAFPQLAMDDPMWWLLFPVLISAIAIMLTPSLLARLISFGQRILRYERHEIAPPSRKTSAATIALCGLGWCCNGLHAAIIAIALGAPPGSAITLGVGGFALGAVAGALSLTPAGIGVRELVLGLTLGLLVAGPDLVTLLVLSRALTILGHVIATVGALGAVAGNRFMKRRHVTRRTPTATLPGPADQVQKG